MLQARWPARGGGLKDARLISALMKKCQSREDGMQSIV